MKWYQIILIALLLLILSPLIIFFLICLGIYLPIITIVERIDYKKSAYYRYFKIPFSKKVYNSNPYQFYNYAIEKKLEINYIHQKEMDYFIYKNEIFIFPDFNAIQYNNEQQCWEVLICQKKQKTFHLLEDYLKQKKAYIQEKIDLPIRLIVSIDYFDIETIDLSKLPKSLYVIRHYNSAFNSEDNAPVYFIPKTTKALYEMMKENENLGGEIKLVAEELIVWTFDKVFYRISVDLEEGYFEVCSNKKLKYQITHWHPNPDEIYEVICRIGTKGNVMIIKKFIFFGVRVLYMGPVKDCSFKKRKIHLGKIYYFYSN